MKNSRRFENALEAIDITNTKDPNREVWEDVSHPKELLYGRRMSKVLNSYYPQASEELQLAVRGQHISRWEIPRSDYDMNKAGYHKWRNDLKDFHAKKIGDILPLVGYNKEEVERVQFLIKKNKIKSDSDSQVLEDVVCLVFLEFYFDAFANKHEREKLIEIIKKTWAKMSDMGRDAALKINFSETSMNLIQEALA